MPNLFELEPYDECFIHEDKFSMPAYCVADVYIRPTNSSEIWNNIAKNSHPWKTQYRHDHLVYGVCINKCQTAMKRVDKMMQRKYFLQTPRNFSEITSDRFEFSYSIEDNLDFGRIMDECVNFKLRQKYDLEADLQVQYCDIKGRIIEMGKII